MFSTLISCSWRAEVDKYFAPTRLPAYRQVGGLVPRTMRYRKAVICLDTYRFMLLLTRYTSLLQIDEHGCPEMSVWQIEQALP
jgi:hypothetical protein